MEKKIIALSVVFLLIGAGTGFYVADFTYRSRINRLESRVSNLEMINRISENVVVRTTNIVAVSRDGQGVLTNLTVDLSPGSGGIFVKTGPLVGFVFQDAQIDAVRAAANFTNFSIDEEGNGIRDIHTHFLITSESGEGVDISSIEGPSAGAAAAILTVAALMGENIRSDVIITGTIRPDGSIGRVGGIMEKAEAAEAAGKELFLVPEGQTLVVDHSREPISHLKSYASEHDWRLEIVEVSDLKEATEYFFE